MGPAGYWMVIVAGLLSMLSALQANLLAASRFARTMSSDRTLPRYFETTSAEHGMPVAAIRLTAVTVAFVLVAVPDVAAAGAVSSLIFLASFAVAHGIAYLARRRALEPSPFQSPAFPAVPLIGGGSCLALALYQALAVPSAGTLAALWLGLGAILFVTHLAPSARVVEARSEGFDPLSLRLRGRSPLVLVPIANPASARTLLTMAGALAPSSVSRVQLLSVVRRAEASGTEELPRELLDAQAILGGALSAALAEQLRPEALITIHDDPWTEIARVAAQSQCDSLLLGVGDLDRSRMKGPLQRLISAVDVDIVILRAPVAWRPERALRILVPSRGGLGQSPTRARLIGSLGRSGPREVMYLEVLPERTSAEVARRAEESLAHLAHDEAPRSGRAVVTLSDDVVAEVARQAADVDLVILGLHRGSRGRREFGAIMLDIAQATRCPLLMISQRR